MPDARTISLYDTEAEGYADLVSSDKPYPRLEAFITSMPPGGTVLDLGCGPGNWAARMIDCGLTVDALDASAGMATVARKTYGIEVRVGTFDDVSGEAIYDGIWAHFSLLHAPRNALPHHLATLGRALKPGGRFLLAMKLGEGSGRDGKDRLYTYYAEPELLRLTTEAGFEILDRELGTGTGFDGSSHAFIVLHATRP
ncbi:class I SAM-dependent DNA methyltransferase [Tropicimonas marinistellae]|uniref:class I SAM-dependent DNA methyltransferase n=1 Tax=Tropicimonas marinistellae TaxID=1739787 RepID=UPI0008341E1C|nr:class I SAM-dependent methyltransferase [Tropicimonas marinistellae]